MCSPELSPGDGSTANRRFGGRGPGGACLRDRSCEEDGPYPGLERRSTARTVQEPGIAAEVTEATARDTAGAAGPVPGESADERYATLHFDRW
jgi:hypothetical protein